MEKKKSILEGITEHDVVEVFNPLSDDFEAKIGRSVIVKSNPQQTPATGNQAADSYLQQLANQPSNGGHSSKAHVQQTVIIPSGQSLRMPGDVAMVAVRQLAKEYMQRTGQKKQMANTDIYMEVEKKIVINSESMLQRVSTETIEQRFERQMAELNKTDELKEEEHEQGFPQFAGTSTGTDSGIGTNSPKTRGRKKRSTVVEPQN